MKKIARFSALVMAVIMVLMLAACGPASKIVGKWEGELLGIEMTMEFKAGGEVEIDVDSALFDESGTSDYKFKGDKLYIDGDEVDYEFKDNDTLILEIEGVDIELERVK